MADQISVKSSDSFRVLDSSELDLFNRLREAAPSLIVFAQVNMSQVYYLHSKRIDTLNRFGEIGRTSIDFLLCRRDDNSIVAAVALRAKAAAVSRTLDSDTSKFAALKEAGIPLMVYAREKLPDITTIRRSLTPLIDKGKQFGRGRSGHLRH